MPVYHISDPETGIQLEVEGDDEPRQEDAEELVGNELDFLKTNLFSFPGGKFILDVGPTRKIGETFDKLAALNPAVEKAHKEYGPIPERIKGESISDFSKRLQKHVFGYREFMNKTVDEEMRKSATAPTSSLSKMAENLSPGSFLMLSHGAKGGGLYADEDFGGHKFTLSNVASLLGTNAQSISNIINASCYGGRCTPEEFEKIFPAARSVSQISTNDKNWLSLLEQEKGNFLTSGGTNAPTKELWERGPSGWILNTNPPMRLER